MVKEETKKFKEGFKREYAMDVRNEGWRGKRPQYNTKDLKEFYEKNLKEFREIYDPKHKTLNQPTELFEWDSKNKVNVKEGYIKNSFYNRGNLRKVAKDILKYASKSPKETDSQTYNALLSTKLYDILGMADNSSVQRRAKEAISKDKRTTEGQKTKAYNILEDLAEHSKAQQKSLEKTLITTGIISILASLFFLSPNLTGNIVGNLSFSNSNLIGTILFILGIGLFILKSRV